MKAVVFPGIGFYPARMPSPAENHDRPYDLIVWGATGFTGRLVVEYLAGRYPVGESLRWAVAGRDRVRLEKLLSEHFDENARPDMLTADSNDPASLTELARSGRVILTTVGPYARYGTPLVEACVENGTDYCDLCGEVQWMRKMIDRYQPLAEASGARIVMSCGFDSIPSDIGVLSLQQHAQATCGSACEEIVLLVRAMKGGASGGTFASMLNAIKEARSDRDVARTLVDPYSLNPDGERQGPDGRDQTGARYNKDAGAWTAPFVMAAVNTRVVRRSHALLGYPYGRNFRYSEATMTGKGPGGSLRARLMSFGIGAFMLASSIDFTRRWIVEKLIPAPGEGPSRTERENGYFNLLLLGKTGNGDLLRLRVKGDRDPGYGSTSKMLAESAVCLASDARTVGGGFWTPAAALGVPLRDRLEQNAGLSFTPE